MAVSRTSSSTVVPSIPPPKPKSPPDYPDLYGKRRELAKVQLLEREIGFLQEELKYVEGLQPVSHCMKEVADFVVANSDPLIPTSRRIRRSCRFWKWLCGKTCFNMSWICCCGFPNCNCFSRPSFRSLEKILCCRSCYICGCPTFPDCPSTNCKCSCFKCPKLSRFSFCTVNCFYPSCCIC